MEDERLYEIAAKEVYHRAGGRSPGGLLGNPHVVEPVIGLGAATTGGVWVFRLLRRRGKK
jgi:hypothetical protein